MRQKKRKKIVKDRILGIIPVSGYDPEFKSGKIPYLGRRRVLDWTFIQAKRSKLIDRLVIATDSELVAGYAKKLGIEVPFIRSTGTRSFSLAQVYNEILTFLEKEGYSPDWVAQLWFTYPFRMRGLIDDSIKTALASGLDSSFLAYPEYKTYWYQRDGVTPERIETNLHLLREHRPPIYRELQGLFSITKAHFIKTDEFFARDVGIIPIKDFGCAINLHDYQERQLSNLVAKVFDLDKRAPQTSDIPDAAPILNRPAKTHRRTTIVAKRKLKKGIVIKRGMIKAGLSANGISFDLLSKITGKYRLAYDIKAGEPITFGVIK